MSDWIRCKGLVPRVVAYFCRRGCCWAKKYAMVRINEQLEDERMEKILGECFSTGKTVVGSVDEEGVFRTKVIEEEE
ncbi:MAG TPA: hypothetical protein VEP90_27035 [Methylomirabilota bacterium]|nr:hypothetical protein [Methylomirabilota bacterium]